MFKPILYTLVITLTSLVFYGQVNAVDPSDFEAGRIIDDAVFTDKTAMNVNEIQAFLDAKMPNCDVNGTGTSPWYAPDYDGDGKQERWEYGQYKGNPTPFTCLKDYVENPTTQVNNYGGGSVSGGKTAAEIIWQAAQDHDINPQVLLVTLQKESSLVTDAWPFERQFDRAMGYACPDSGPNNSANCDESHYGFANQINKAAWQFRRYLTYPDNYNFAVGNRYIQYNPSASCGGSTVNIQTAVTAALYNYTPYQPNQAALNNYPGTASCGAYGNRNFWFTFNEWFGGTRLDDYSLTEVNITPTVDIVEGGERAFAVRLKNTGAFTLHEAGTNGSDEVRIVTSPLGRNSTVSGSYESKTKATSVLHSVYESDGVTLSEDQNTIETNEIGRFVVRISIPEDFEPGAFTEILAARLDNRMNISDPFEFNINILEKKYSASFGGSSLNLSGKPGETVAAAVRYKNTGNTTWYDFTSRPDSSTRP
ncbi:TPA: hypothetical protein EYN47_03575, partial [Candidatus Saccharibacteria bacterium]|nr:hypothetical protein [Candidatus Saccharibacteria bacterium]